LKKKNDLVISAILFILSITFLIMGFTVPSPQFNDKTIGAGVFPQIWVAVLAVLSVLLFFRTLKEMKKQKNSEQDSEVKDTNKNRLFLFVCISLILYLALMPVIGYLISTFLYCFICVFVFGYESYKLNKKRGIVISLITSILLTAVSPGAAL